MIDMTRIQAQRLLNMATALRESVPEIACQFDMGKYSWNCGTPACAIGHYAYRRDIQRMLKLGGEQGNCLQFTKGETRYDKDAHFADPRILKHFGIDVQEAEKLFEEDGCGNAQTTIQAAKFIENFLDEKDWAFT